MRVFSENTLRLIAEQKLIELAIIGAAFFLISLWRKK
jgi:hypothetical protein